MKVTSPQPALPRKRRVLTDGACYMLQQKGNISDDQYMSQQPSLWLCSFVFRKKESRKSEPTFTELSLGQVLVDSKLGEDQSVFPLFFRVG